jgi:hypothetical protein
MADDTQPIIEGRYRFLDGSDHEENDFQAMQRDGAATLQMLANRVAVLKEKRKSMDAALETLEAQFAEW